MTFLNIPAHLDWPAQFCLLLTAGTWVASLVTANVSQVDRLWTFLPTIYTAYYALLPLWPNEQPFLFVPYAPKELGYASVKDYSPRALLIFGLVVVWMCRLSYNTWRRGLFDLKDEDYRWAVLRAQLPPWLFQITNLTFIAFTQNVLLLSLGLPVHVAAVFQPHSPLSSSDYALAALALVVLGIEFTADNQQYAFHAYKHAYLAKKKAEEDGKEVKVKEYDANEHWVGARLAWTPDDARRGFVTRGLWRYSRHPNFACEQGFWWIITLLPLVSPFPPNIPTQADLPTLPTLLRALASPSQHPALLLSVKQTLAPAVHLLPALALSLLFISSTTYTEAISKSKYRSTYGAYQRRVGMFSPHQTLGKWVWMRLWWAGEDRKGIEEVVWGDSEAPSKRLKKE
ncbi:unnamed protein product [Cyclocybe aegerita]|uniref:DUF1295-domain-containing protein n=1 Tax=Cyclocybe aegerita TaxID=1973307 RepID=A0A8S0XWC8_CYCAE|nr:unnamed protein product [Cyclocybe aegerita]